METSVQDPFQAAWRLVREVGVQPQEGPSAPFAPSALFQQDRVRTLRLSRALAQALAFQKTMGQSLEKQPQQPVKAKALAQAMRALRGWTAARADLGEWGRAWRKWRLRNWSIDVGEARATWLADLVRLQAWLTASDYVLEGLERTRLDLDAWTLTLTEPPAQEALLDMQMQIRMSSSTLTVLRHHLSNRVQLGQSLLRNATFLLRLREAMENASTLEAEVAALTSWGQCEPKSGA